MSDIGRPLRRHHGVPREDPAYLPQTWPDPVADPVPAVPVVDPAQPLQPEREPLVPA